MSRIDTRLKQTVTQRLLDNGGIYSQAQNFLGVVSTDVDPRTGGFMLAISLPTLIANHLSGPTLAPTLSYNAQASLQNKGFGMGWSLLLSEIVWNATSSSLRLGSGEQFSIDRHNSEPGVGGSLAFFDHKLNDLLVTRISDDSFRIDRKTGEIEILTRQHSNSTSFVLSEMRTAEGHRLFLSWRLAAPDTYRVDTITDQTGRTLLAVEAYTGGLDFIVNPADAPHTLTLRFANERVSRVMLSNVAGSFNFIYRDIDVGFGVSLWFPTALSGPLGATDDIFWTMDASAGHRLPEGAPLTHLPRVTSWRQSSGSPDSVLTHSYTWVVETNFLGYGSSVGFNWTDGRDNLYWVEHAYRYTCTETLRHGGNELATIKRTWNNFHLPVEIVSTSGVAQTTTRTTYWINDQVGWGSQPAYCQLPRTLTTTYRNTRAGTERSEQTTYTYDDSGNILNVVYPTGVTQTNTYYPADNSTAGCPPDALGQRLGMVRFLEKTTTTPAPSEFSAPILSTRYEYENLESLAAEDGAQPHAVVVKETTFNETEQTVIDTTVQTYEKVKSSPHYGRETRAVTTLNDKSTTTVFRYQLQDDQLTTELTVQGYDFSTRPTSHSMTSSCRSALTGLTAKETSPAGVVTAYEYDVLGRIIKTVIAEGTSFQATRTGKYHINDEAYIAQNRPSGLTAIVAAEETDASGQHRRIWLDGAGREVCVELEDLDTAPGTFREISRTHYDALGRNITQVGKEWFEGREMFELTTQTEYDDWGGVSKVTGPTGVQSYTLTDPVSLRTEQWQQDTAGRATPRQVTLSNVAGSPVTHELRDEDGRLVRTIEISRDGLDRVVKQTTRVPGRPDIVTHFSHDAYSRLTEQTQPDGTRIQWTYAGHSDGEHPEMVELIGS